MDLDRPGDDNAANKVNITSKLQTIDYSHGSSYSNVKSVDYNHGAMGAPPQPPPTDAFRDPAYPPAFDIPGYGSGGGRHLPYPSPYEGYQYPPGGGGYPPAPPGTFFPPGFDAATLFAAYASQAGTVFIHLDLHVLLLYSGKFSRGKFFTNFPDSVISRVKVFKGDHPMYIHVYVIANFCGFALIHENHETFPPLNFLLYSILYTKLSAVHDVCLSDQRRLCKIFN